MLEYFPTEKWKDEGWTDGRAYIESIVGEFQNSQLPHILDDVSSRMEPKLIETCSASENRVGRKLDNMTREVTSMHVKMIEIPKIKQQLQQMVQLVDDKPGSV